MKIAINIFMLENGNYTFGPAKLFPSPGQKSPLKKMSLKILLYRMVMEWELILHNTTIVLSRSLSSNGHIWF